MDLRLSREYGDQPFEVQSHERPAAGVFNRIFTVPVYIDKHRSSGTLEQCRSLEARKLKDDGFMPPLHIVQQTLLVLGFDREFHHFRDGVMPVDIRDNGHLRWVWCFHSFDPFHLGRSSEGARVTGRESGAFPKMSPIIISGTNGK